MSDDYADAVGGDLKKLLEKKNGCLFWHKILKSKRKFL